MLIYDDKEENTAVIQRENGTYVVHDWTNTNTTGEKADFDEQPFLDAYSEHQRKKKEEKEKEGDSRD